MTVWNDFSASALAYLSKNSRPQAVSIAGSGESRVAAR